MDFGVKTNIGSRKTNQDFYLKSDQHMLYIIADGMGGHNAGEIASELSVKLISDFLDLKLDDSLTDKEIEEVLRISIEKANQVVYKKSIEEDKLKGMGTTVSMAYIRGDRLFIAHVGDSSVFIISNNEIVKLTMDHSLVEELLKKGSITEEEARNHPQKNIITRAVGTDKTIEVDILSEDIRKDDILVLCTDGLTNMIEKEEIKEEIENTASLEMACENLVNKAKDSGGKDNITMMAIRI